MFGSYQVPLEIIEDDLSVSITKERGNLIYRRDCFGDSTQKRILGADAKILINPIEPLTLPKRITDRLFIEFKEELVVKPDSSEQIFLKFPLEIGIFISSDNEDFKILDVVSLTKQKYTLYGDPKNGMICKYWMSDIYSSIPDADHLLEGILKLNIKNSTNNWLDVNKVVLHGNIMKIYYNSYMVSMALDMNIIGSDIAEISSLKTPLKGEMNRSRECFVPRTIPGVPIKFTMGWGI